MKIAVFVSGRGTNLNAILNSPLCKDEIEVYFVVSDKANPPAFEIAQEHGIITYSLSKKDKMNSFSFDELGKIFLDTGIELIVLAGFLKLVPESFINLFEKKIINIHPALLPKYGGKGMYGMNVHKAVFESGDKISGATVHFVNPHYDEGSIIQSEIVDISGAQNPEEVAALVLKSEHTLLPKVVSKFKNGELFNK
ncbi:MAG: phosphoribosylglycinamide formyltransferase [Ignavibacteriaceae bacterium]|nr:phosphoribosylglycinamide formyltransferase [Ignavibacteriaceae bacterium]